MKLSILLAIILLLTIQSGAAAQANADNAEQIEQFALELVSTKSETERNLLLAAKKDLVTADLRKELVKHGNRCPLRRVERLFLVRIERLLIIGLNERSSLPVSTRLRFRFTQLVSRKDQWPVSNRAAASVQFGSAHFCYFVRRNTSSSSRAWQRCTGDELGVVCRGYSRCRAWPMASQLWQSRATYG